MDISIENCNNIQSGSIHISESKLNIKFGINGTGKSTIAKAIRYELESPDKLTELTPFRLQKQTDLKPKVCIPQEIKTVFERDRTVIGRHIKNIIKTRELIEESNVQKIHIANYLNTVQRHNPLELKDVSEPNIYLIANSINKFLFSHMR
jgi:AAA15 family ATPase/GTPase